MEIIKNYLNKMYFLYFCFTDTLRQRFPDFVLRMGFEPMIFSVKGRCVKPTTLTQHLFFYLLYKDNEFF